MLAINKTEEHWAADKGDWNSNNNTALADPATERAATQSELNRKRSVITDYRGAGLGRHNGPLTGASTSGLSPLSAQLVHTDFDQTSGRQSVTVSKLTWSLTSTETTRFIRDGCTASVIDLDGLIPKLYNSATPARTEKPTSVNQIWFFHRYFSKVLCWTVSNKKRSGWLLRTGDGRFLGTGIQSHATDVWITELVWNQIKLVVTYSSTRDARRSTASFAFDAVSTDFAFVGSQTLVLPALWDLAFRRLAGNLFTGS